jgi:hypothetical protein
MLKEAFYYFSSPTNLRRIVANTLHNILNIYNSDKTGLDLLPLASPVDDYFELLSAGVTHEEVLDWLRDSFFADPGSQYQETRVGIIITFLDQVMARLAARDKESGLKSSFPEIVLGSALFATKIVEDVAVYNEDFQQMCPELSLDVLKMIEYQHLRANKFEELPLDSLALKGRLTNIFKKMNHEDLLELEQGILLLPDSQLLMKAAFTAMSDVIQDRMPQKKKEASEGSPKKQRLRSQTMITPFSMFNYSLAERSKEYEDVWLSALRV